MRPNQPEIVLSFLAATAVAFAGAVSSGCAPAEPTAEPEPEPEISGVLQVPIENLDFSVRTYNCLKKEKIDTLGMLVENTEEDLLAIRNFGKRSLNEVIDKLADLELKLKSMGGDGEEFGAEEIALGDQE